MSRRLTLLVKQAEPTSKPGPGSPEQRGRGVEQNGTTWTTAYRLVAPFYRVFANTLGTGRGSTPTSEHAAGPGGGAVMSAVKKYVVPFVILALLAAMVLVFTVAGTASV